MSILPKANLAYDDFFALWQLLTIIPFFSFFSFEFEVKCNLNMYFDT